MPKKIKNRRVDFTHEEMESMTGLSRKAFDDALKRFCEIYQFEKSDFKSVKDEAKSGYFFPPEVAELLALLLRHLQENPMARSNADDRKVTAEQVAEYNRAILQDIDKGLPKVFKENIYALPAHDTAQNLVDWTERLVKQFAYFLVNLVTLKEQDIGASLKLFTQKLDQMNYSLFKGNYVVSKIKQSNIEEVCQKNIEEIDGKQLNQTLRLGERNISLDKVIAELLRCGLEHADDIRKMGFPELDEILARENRINLFMGQEMISELYKDKKIPPLEDERQTYYCYRIEVPENSLNYLQNENRLQSIRKKNAEWKSIDDAIRAGIFREPQEESLKKKRQILNDNIQYALRDIEECRCLLKELDEQEMEEKKDEFCEEIKTKYVEHCKYIDKNHTELNAIAERFIGQFLLQMMR